MLSELGFVGLMDCSDFSLDKYILDGNLPREDGTEIPLRTVWIIDTGTRAPRFITAYPL